MIDWKPDPAWATNDAIKAEIAECGIYKLEAAGGSGFFTWELRESTVVGSFVLAWGEASTLAEAKAAAEESYRANASPPA